MNIYVLDKDPRLAAAYHNDRHVSKMLLDCVQIMSMAHVEIDGMDVASKNIPLMILPRKHRTMEVARHICVRWACATSANYEWLHTLTRCLLVQFTERFGTVHMYEDLVNQLMTLPVNIHISDRVTEHPQCMPLEYKITGNVVRAYREYYFGEKNHLAEWRNGGPPLWWTNMMRDTV